MAEHKHNQDEHKTQCDVDLSAFHIRDQVMYHKDHGTLGNALRQHHYDMSKLQYQQLSENPSHYSLGQILSIHPDTHCVSLTDVMRSDDQTLVVHAAFVHKFRWFEYSAFRRGVTVDFFDDSRDAWMTGRIEHVIGQFAVLQGKEEMVPVFYLRAYEEVKQDEWSEATDHVLTEYVRDVATALARTSDDDVIDPDAFRAAMTRLGIRASASRNKAFGIFEQLKHQIIAERRDQENGLSLTMQLLMSEGHVLGPYRCVGACGQPRESQGILLSNCKHCVCTAWFGQLMQSAVAAEGVVRCPRCAEGINPIDIQRHGSEDQYAMITQLQLKKVQLAALEAQVTCTQCARGSEIANGLTVWICGWCGSDNCLVCKRAHPETQSCEQGQLGHPFRRLWQHDFAADAVDGAVLKDVDQDTDEYAEVVGQLECAAEQVVGVQRVEHGRLWERYVAYATGLGGALQEVRVWHGTRKTAPELIYTNGFLKEKSRGGGCLWFAVRSSYSMRGFQHPVGNGHNQLFLCLVAGGNAQDVKYIRKNRILNVYKDEATYPAYLITYK